MTLRTALLHALLTLAFITACSGSPTNPLLGSWKTTDPTGHSVVTPGALNFSDVLTFTGTETYTVVNTWTIPTTASSLPGCMRTITTSGGYSVMDSTLTTSQTRQTDVRTGCMNSSDNASSTSNMRVTQVVTFSINGTTLSLDLPATGMSSAQILTYTKE